MVCRIVDQMAQTTCENVRQILQTEDGGERLLSYRQEHKIQTRANKVIKVKRSDAVNASDSSQKESTTTSFVGNDTNEYLTESLESIENIKDEPITNEIQKESGLDDVMTEALETSKAIRSRCLEIKEYCFMQMYKAMIEPLLEIIQCVDTATLESRELAINVDVDLSKISED